MATLSGSVGKGCPNKPADVTTIQRLLNASIHLIIPYRTLGVDGSFGSLTQAAIEEFQRRVVGLKSPDGRVDPGGRTLRALDGEARPQPAAMVSPSTGVGADWPPPPAFKPLSGNAERAAAFGKFEYEADPTPDNKENIKILGTWAKDNIQMVSIPQLVAVKGGSKAQFHRLAAPQFIALWARWDKAGLLDRVKTWGGTFVPRFVRGSTTSLSNHAYGTAFDINMEWNKLNHVPALVGKQGCVRELVPIANELGFFWGGHYATRPDGMHFEVAVIKNVP